MFHVKVINVCSYHFLSSSFFLFFFQKISYHFLINCIDINETIKLRVFSSKCVITRNEVGDMRIVHALLQYDTHAHTRAHTHTGFEFMSFVF